MTPDRPAHIAAAVARIDAIPHGRDWFGPLDAAITDLMKEAKTEAERHDVEAAAAALFAKRNKTGMYGAGQLDRILAEAERLAGPLPNSAKPRSDGHASDVVKPRPPPETAAPRSNGSADSEVERTLNAARDALRTADNDNARLLAVRDGAEALENIGANGSAFDRLRDIGISYSVKTADAEIMIDEGIRIKRTTATFGTPDIFNTIERQAPEPEPSDEIANSEPKQKPRSNGGAEPKAKPRDVNDILREHGPDAVRDAFDQAVSEDPNPARSSVRHDESGRSPNKRNAVAIAAALAGIKTAKTLQTMTFAPLKYIVPGLIVEGCVLLAGKPKAGKSWFSYDVALAVASGRFCLGDKKCVEGDVLYLALEDNNRRLQSRATKLLPTFAGVWPERFNFQTRWPRANEGGIEAIDQWCEAHPDARLVVIDVLAAFRAPSSSSKNAYDQDYAAISQLQELASRRSITILVIHHTRKGASDDPVEEISGTLGLGGGADAFLVLKRKGVSGTLIGRGRDIEDHDLGLQFSKETCHWTILGEAAVVQGSEQRARVLVALENSNEGLSTGEIVSHANLASRGAADVLLSNMANDGQIERIRRGIYGLPGTTAKIAKINKKDKKEDEYGENPANDHTRPRTRPSNESKAQSEAAHTPDPPSHVSVVEFLTWALTSGRRLVGDIEASARAEGLLGERQRIDTKPFRAAKQILGVVVERDGFGPGSKVYWRLPDSGPDQGLPVSQADSDAAVQAPAREPENDQ
jgi:hypothetical protein